MGKLKENEEVPKVCLTKQPTGKRDVEDISQKRNTIGEQNTNKLEPL